MSLAPSLTNYYITTPISLSTLTFHLSRLNMTSRRHSRNALPIYYSYRSGAIKGDSINVPKILVTGKEERKMAL